jgi:hypothetical protein
MDTTGPNVRLIGLLFAPLAVALSSALALGCFRTVSTTSFLLRRGASPMLRLNAHIRSRHGSQHPVDFGAART